MVTAVLTKGVYLLASGLAIAALGLILSACGGSAETVTVVQTQIETVTETVTETETVEVEAAPDENTPEPSEESSATPAGATVRTVGGTGIDDGLSFRVLSIREVSGFPVDEYSDPIAAVPGAKLVRADVVVKNNTPKPFSPICGSGNAVLIDQKDRNFNLIEDGFDIANSNLCEDIAPGFQSTVILGFQIPKDSKIAALALWNAESETDYSGESYVLFRK
jgi:hypothetical protein